VGMVAVAVAARSTSRRQLWGRRRRCMPPLGGGSGTVSSDGMGGWVDGWRDWLLDRVLRVCVCICCGWGVGVGSGAALFTIGLSHNMIRVLLGSTDQQNQTREAESAKRSDGKQYKVE
jgi:hypothetical protein